MLREGATLKAEPCPYCGGVRVMRGGEALCVGCGSEPDAGRLKAAGAAAPRAEKAGGGAPAAGPAVAVLEKRLAEAAAALPPSRGAERAALLDEVASLAAAIRSLESPAGAA